MGRSATNPPPLGVSSRASWARTIGIPESNDSCFLKGGQLLMRQSEAVAQYFLVIHAQLERQAPTALAVAIHADAEPDLRQTRAALIYAIQEPSVAQPDIACELIEATDRSGRNSSARKHPQPFVATT